MTDCLQKVGGNEKGIFDDGMPNVRNRGSDSN